MEVTQNHNAVFVVTTGIITHAPVNQVAVVGNHVVFTCISDNRSTDIWWHFYHQTEDRSSLVSKGNNVNDNKFTNVKVSAGGRTLQISSIEEDNSGLYQCSEEGEHQRAAQLRVLG